MEKTRHALLATLLVSLTVAAGQALAGLPNVELITFLVFVSGYLLGSVAGATVGAVAITAHSLFNAFGAAAPPVLAAQIAGYAAIGAAGLPVGRAVLRVGRGRGAVVAGLAGAAGVLVYQVLVNAAAWFAYPTGVPLRGYIAGGVAFASVQVAWNAALFATGLRPALVVCGKVYARRGAGA